MFWVLFVRKYSKLTKFIQKIDPNSRMPIVTNSVSTTKNLKFQIFSSRPIEMSRNLLSRNTEFVTIGYLLFMDSVDKSAF